MLPNVHGPQTLLISLTALNSAGGAIAPPCAVYGSSFPGILFGGGGCLAMNAGTMMKSSITTTGNTASSCGSRHMNEYTANAAKVCVGCFHERTRNRRCWNTKTTPTLRAPASLAQTSHSAHNTPTPPPWRYTPSIKPPKVPTHHRQ